MGTGDKTNNTYVGRLRVALEYKVSQFFKVLAIMKIVGKLESCVMSTVDTRARFYYLRTNDTF